MLIRLFTFRPDRPGESADELLRQAILPALQYEPRVSHVYAARASIDDVDQRIVVSVWDDSDGRPEEMPDVRQPFGFETSEHALDAHVELHHLEVTLTFEPGGPPQILRIFRGRAKPGELDNYVEHVRDGTMADALAEHGPDALFLARVSSTEFVTVSAWTTWDRIAAATGGNLRHPIGTRHAHLLEGGAAFFYEIVPNTPAGRTDGATAGADEAGALEAGSAGLEPDAGLDLLAVPPEPALAQGS